MKLKGNLIFVTLLILLSTIVLATAISQTGYYGNFVRNVWSTSNSVENITFVGGDNHTLYITLPKYANVTYANLNISTEDNLQNFSVSVDGQGVIYP